MTIGDVEQATDIKGEIELNLIKKNDADAAKKPLNLLDGKQNKPKINMNGFIEM